MHENIITRAMRFAEAAHHGQVRKYTGVPYIIHPYAVTALVRSVDPDGEVAAAALLHDTIEDTATTYEQLRDRFGFRVADLVNMVTDVSKPSDGNRRVRKQLDLEHIARGCAEAKTIKLADLIDNTTSIVAYDPQFAKVYLQEKAALLEVLKDGSPTLWNIAHNLVTMHQRPW